MTCSVKDMHKYIHWMWVNYGKHMSTESELAVFIDSVESVDVHMYTCMNTVHGVILHGDLILHGSSESSRII